MSFQATSLGTDSLSLGTRNAVSGDGQFVSVARNTVSEDGYTRP